MYEYMPAGCTCGIVFCICAHMSWPCVVLWTAIFSLGSIKAATVTSLWRSCLSNTGVVEALTNLRPRKLDSPRVREWSR